MVQLSGTFNIEEDPKMIKESYTTFIKPSEI